MAANVQNGGEPNHSEASMDGTAGSRENDCDSQDEKISSDLDDSDIANTFHEVKLEDSNLEKEEEEVPKDSTTQKKAEISVAPPVLPVNTVQLRRSNSSEAIDERRASERRTSHRRSEVISPPVVTSPTELSALSTLTMFKNWSVNKFVCTKQLLSEKLGRASITLDADVQQQIESTRETQLKFDQMYQEARSLTEAIGQMVSSQSALHNTFKELSQKMPDLNAEFECNADSMKMIFRKGEVLVGDLNFFTSNIVTLCGKTIEDTLLTIKQYEAARLEFDAHRTSLEAGLNNPNTAEDAKTQLQAHREKFEKLRADVIIKMKLLNENKLKVMRKQLFLLHCSVTSYFTELNGAMLEQQKRFKTVRSATVETNFLSDEL